MHGKISKLDSKLDRFLVVNWNPRPYRVSPMVSFLRINFYDAVSYSVLPGPAMCHTVIFLSNWSHQTPHNLKFQCMRFGNLGACKRYMVFLKWIYLRFVPWNAHGMLRGRITVQTCVTKRGRWGLWLRLVQLVVFKIVDSHILPFTNKHGRISSKLLSVCSQELKTANQGML